MSSLQEQLEKEKREHEKVRLLLLEKNSQIEELKKLINSFMKATDLDLGNLQAGICLPSSTTPPPNSCNFLEPSSNSPPLRADAELTKVTNYASPPPVEHETKGTAPIEEEKEETSVESLNASFCGSWVQGQTAGGCLNSKLWRMNPQYFLTVREPTSVQIMLAQQQSNAIGFYVFHNEGPLPFPFT